MQMSMRAGCWERKKELALMGSSTAMASSSSSGELDPVVRDVGRDGVERRKKGIDVQC
jgi:hypothetical protein